MSYFHFFFIDNLVPYARFTEVQWRRENEPENAEFKCNFVVDFFQPIGWKKVKASWWSGIKVSVTIKLRVQFSECAI